MIQRTAPIQRSAVLRRSPIKRKTGIKKVSPSWYKNQCIELFMARYRGKPCEICRSLGTMNTYNTAAHHIISKGSCPHHKFTPENIVVLCQKHHMFDRLICPHSMNSLTVQRFMEWLSFHKPEQFLWCKRHEHDMGKINFKELYLKLKGQAVLL